MTTSTGVKLTGKRTIPHVHEEADPQAPSAPLKAGTLEPWPTAWPGDLPLPPPALREPRRLVRVGRGGVRPRPRGGPRRARLDRLLRLPLVPRDGARELRGRGDRAADERALRLHQGRPRGAPRRRRHLHGRDAGDDRRRRLAAERLPHPRRRAVLVRHLLPARAAPGHAELAQRADRDRRGVGRAARGDPRAGRRDRRAPARRGGAEAAGGGGRPRLARRRRAPGCASSTTPSTAASAARRSSRPPPRSSSCSGRGEREMALHTLRRMASGGMYDQVGGGFARYSVDRVWLVPHFEKMLYDNALLARAYVHAWQVTGDAAVRARGARDARLGAGRAAPGGGRVRLRAGRRLRGRRGQVLRLDAAAGPRGARRRSPTRRSSTSG